MASAGWLSGRCATFAVGFASAALLVELLRTGGAPQAPMYLDSLDSLWGPWLASLERQPIMGTFASPAACIAILLLVRCCLAVPGRTRAPRDSMDLIIRQAVLEAVLQRGEPLPSTTEELRACRELALKAVRRHGGTWRYAWYAALRSADRERIQEAMRQDGWGALLCANEALWADRELVLEAVRQGGWALRFAASELRADRTVVLEAMRHDNGALQYAAEELRADRGLVLEALRQSSKVLEFAAEELRADREVVLEAVRQSGGSLRFVAEELRADRLVVLEAVRQDGWALRLAADELRSDRELVLAAVRQNGWAFCYAAVELRADREVVLEAVRKEGKTLQSAAQELRADREVALEAIRQDGTALHYAAEELQADRELALEAFRSVSGKLRSDHEREFEVLRACLPVKHRGDPALQPGAVLMNPFAIPCARGVACNVTGLECDDHVLQYEATVGLAGHQVQGRLPLDATLGTLGQVLRAVQLPGAAAAGGAKSFVHMILPGAEAPVSPLDLLLPLRDFAA